MTGRRVRISSLNHSGETEIGFHELAGARPVTPLIPTDEPPPASSAADPAPEDAAPTASVLSAVMAADPEFGA